MTKMQAQVRYGRTELSVSALCIGTSGWDHISAPEAVALLGAATSDGVNFVDTSNIYAGGRAETTLGAAFATPALSGRFVLQTKLDRNPVTGDFGYQQMFTSLQESLDRLGLDRLQVLMLHDPEHIGFQQAMVRGGPVDALVEMREQGLADHIGISGGPVDMLQQFVETDIFDSLITHNRLTLLDQSADALLTAATERDLGITNAAPFGAGILTGDPRFAGRYAYAPISPEREAAFQRLVAVCADLGIPLGAAALQFSLRDSRVHSTVVGISSERRLQEALTWANTPISDADWTQIQQAGTAP